MVRYGFFAISLALSVFISSIHPQTLKIHQIRALEYPYIKAEFSISHITPLVNVDETNFHIYENDWLVSAFHVKKIEPDKDPKNLIMLVDSSESISPKNFENQKKAAKIIASQLSENDQMSVFSFHDRVKTECSFLAKGNGITECINSIKRNGRYTVLYDALYESIAIAARDNTRRRVIVLFSDGFDENSVINLDEVTRYLQINSVPVFIFSMGSKANIRILKKISQISGGRLYITPQMDDLPKSSFLFNQLLRNTYILKYASRLPDFPGEGKITLKIKMNSSELSLEDQKDYYVPPSQIFSRPESLSMLARPEYFAYGAGVLAILVFFLLVTFITRKSRVQVELSEKSLRAMENTMKMQAPPIAPVLPVEPDKKDSPRAEPVAQDNIPVDFSYGYLMEKQGPGTGNKYLLKWDVITIGRDKNNSIFLDDKSVSLNHAKIKRDHKNRFFIYDMVSENGIFLNDKKLLRPRELNDFDEIQVGRTRLIFRRAMA